MVDTTIIDIDIASSIKDDVMFNTDVDVPSLDLKNKIMGTNDNCLMRTVNTIGSHKKIICADVIDDDFLSATLIKEE